MIKKLVVYDWKVIGRDEDFRKYKKIYHLDVQVSDDFNYPIGTELNFGSNNVARITRLTVDLVNNFEIYEAVALRDWIV